MMAKTVCIFDGHPDGTKPHFIHALCDAYADGASEAGHTVERIRVADLDISPLTDPADFATPPDEPVLSEREKMRRADHFMIAFPLWIGSMPAKARAFFEQAARGNYFLGQAEGAHEWPKQMMKGKSARIVVTMGMPGLLYRFAMDAGALKALERSMLGISGFHPIAHSILGGVEGVNDKQRQKWLDEVRDHGRRAD